MVRARFERDLVRRLQRLKKQIVEYLPQTGIVTNAPFDFPTSSKKLSSFMRWLREQEDAGVLELTRGQTLESAANNAWSNVYIRSAYQKGLAGAAYKIRGAGADVSDRWIDAGFYRPIHADAVGLLYTRTYSDLDGITRAMDTSMSRSLAQSMAEGRGMEATAQGLTDVVDKIGITRGRMIARTEVIRAHAEAALNTYEEAGLEGVEVESEFATAGDDSVCPQCEELEGRVYSIEEARGVIPVHPNCRCAWIPVVTSVNGVSLQ